MYPIRHVTEQGQPIFPITHRKAIVGLATNTLVLSESVDIDVNINTDGEPITINPVVQQQFDIANTHISNIDISVNNINETLKIKANSDTNGVAYLSHALRTPRNINLSGAVTGNVSFDGSKDVTINTSVNHTHSYAGSSSSGGSANSTLRLATARAIRLSGVVNGAVSFDGSGDVTISTSFGNSANYLPLTGGTISGSLTVGGNVACNSRYYQSGYVGSLVATQSSSPTGTMLWAW